MRLYVWVCAKAHLIEDYFSDLILLIEMIDPSWVDLALGEAMVVIRAVTLEARGFGSNPNSRCYFESLGNKSHRAAVR